jgi:hypothetical protein
MYFKPDAVPGGHFRLSFSIHTSALGILWANHCHCSSCHSFWSWIPNLTQFAFIIGKQSRSERTGTTARENMPRTTTMGLTMWQFTLWSACAIVPHATAFTALSLRSVELSHPFNDPFKARFALAHLREKRLDGNGMDDETSVNGKSATIVSSIEATDKNNESTTIAASNNSTPITTLDMVSSSSPPKSTPEQPAPPAPREPLRIRLPLGLKYAFDTVYTIWGYVVTVLGVGLLGCLAGR